MRGSSVPGPDLRPGSPAGNPVQPDPSDLAYSLAGEGVGGGRGADVAIPGDVEDLAKRSVDGLHARLGPLRVEPLELVGDVDQAAGVDDVVGGVHDARGCQGLAVFRPIELVVGRASHDPALQLRDRVVANDATHGAWREDVALLGVDLVRL